MAIEWFVKTDGVEQGPLSSEELKSYVRQGNVRDDSQVRQGRNGAWGPAADMVRFMLPAAAPAPPPVPQRPTGAVPSAPPAAGPPAAGKSPFAQPVPQPSRAAAKPILTPVLVRAVAPSDVDAEPPPPGEFSMQIRPYLLPIGISLAALLLFVVAIAIFLARGDDESPSDDPALDPPVASDGDKR